MKDKKRRFEIISFYDSTKIKNHLEKMAAKGWLLESMSNFGWVYRRIEPKKLTFAVSYYPKASEFDPEPSVEQQIFHDYCEHSGWKLIGTWAQMQIFYNEEENPVPIDTDPRVEVESLHRAMKRNYIPSYVILILLSMIQVGLFFQRVSTDFIGALSSTSLLFSGTVWGMLTIMCVMELVTYFIWHKKAVVAAEEGEFLPTKGSYWIQIITLGWAIGGAILWLLSLAGGEFVIGIISLIWVSIVMFGVNGMKVLLKKWKVSKNVNRVVTFVSAFVLSFSILGIFMMFIIKGDILGTIERVENPELETYEHHGITRVIQKDELPLAVTDLMEVDYDSYSTEWEEIKSPFIAQYKGSVEAKWGDYDIPELAYTITQVRVQAFYDKCFQQIYEEDFKYNTEETPKDLWYNNKRIDEMVWGVEKAYERYAGENTLTRYFLCQDNYLIEINTNWELTEEQMRIAGEKLKAVLK